MSKQRQGISVMVILGIVGFFLGAPISYFFQSPFVQKIQLGEYIKLIPKVLTDNPVSRGQISRELVGNPIAVLIVTCLVTTFIFGMVGYFIDRSKKRA